MHLCVEDWQWWWDAFFASGSVVLYVFLYSTNYLDVIVRDVSGGVECPCFASYSAVAEAFRLLEGLQGLDSHCLLPILSSSVVVVVFSCAIEVQEEIVETGITCEATCLS
ncbi:hypothetical protein V6N11_012083 [Hibiscus sabdariffa]|uniref:Transmembrane 9 superfamily member n=1 Tax=Hibiscus sabdariffa TaxID=183260 RepID=A0ABR2QA45_9ROSI